MRLRIGWGGDLTPAAERAIGFKPTAAAGELRGSSNGLRRERHRVDVPLASFADARRELLELRWFPHDLLRTALASDGVTVLQRCRLGPIAVDAPVRIVERVDEPHRAAMAVVTLAGHPERGVERYDLVLDPALGRVTLTVEKAWELADPLARLARPFSTWVQGHATRRSLHRFRTVPRATARPSADRDGSAGRA